MMSFFTQPENIPYIFAVLSFVSFLPIIVSMLSDLFSIKKNHLKNLLTEGMNLLGTKVKHSAYADMHAYDVGDIDLFQINTEEWAQKVTRILVKVSKNTEAKFNFPSSAVREAWMPDNYKFEFHRYRVDVLIDYLSGQQS